MRCGPAVRRTALSLTAFLDRASTSESAGCLILNEAIVRLEGGGQPPGLWLLFRSPWRLRDRISTLLLPDHDLLRPTRLPLDWAGLLQSGLACRGTRRLCNPLWSRGGRACPGGDADKEREVERPAGGKGEAVTILAHASE